MLKKKNLFISVCFLFTFLFFGFSEASTSSVLVKNVLKPFEKILEKTPEKVITKKLKEMPSFKKDLDTLTKKFLKKTKLSKKLTIKDRLKLFGENLVKKNPNAKDVLNNATINNIVDILYLSKKYGDDFINTTKYVSDVIVQKKDILDKIPLYKLKKLGFRQKLKTPVNKKEVINKFTDIIKKTGKVGYTTGKQLAKYIIAHPKSTAALAAFIWYLNDPVGFIKTLNKFGNNLSEFISVIAKEVVGVGSDTVLKTSKGVSNRLVISFKENFSIGGFLVIILGGIIYLFLYKRKIILEIFARVKNNKKEQNQTCKKKEEDEEGGLL